MLKNLYISYQEQCTLFFTPAPLTPENHAVIIGSMFDSDFAENDLLGIQPDSCLTPFFTGTLLREMFNHDLPNADAILAMAEQAFQMSMDKIKNQQFLSILHMRDFCNLYVQDAQMKFRRFFIIH